MLICVNLLFILGLWNNGAPLSNDQRKVISAFMSKTNWQSSPCIEL